ncbi:hypothetical protein [Nonomuraea sp. NPDC049141]|uniref:hypothetical protein n=1 Tax=unclassified Nonomuraea TaxID=2593643 RepID=UPI0033E4DFFD
MAVDVAELPLVIPARLLVPVALQVGGIQAELLGQSTTTAGAAVGSARKVPRKRTVAIAPIKPRGFRTMAETIYGPHPAEDLAEAALWTPALASDVLSRHATRSQLWPANKPTG